MTTHPLHGGTLPLVFKGKDIKPGWLAFRTDTFFEVLPQMARNPKTGETYHAAHPDGTPMNIYAKDDGACSIVMDPDALYLVHIPEDWTEDDD